MLGAGEEVVGIALLDDAAEIHHGDAPAHLPHDPQVMADEEHGDAEAFLQVDEEVHHLRLDRHVEGRDRLVANQEGGIGHQRAGEDDALALTAGEFVRIAHGDMAGEADAAEHGEGLLGPLGRCAEAMDGERFGHLVTDGEAAVEGTQRILIDHLHPRPRLPPRRSLRLRHGRAVEGDGAGIGFFEAEDHAAEGRLARAGFADDAERLTRADMQADTVDGADGDGAAEDAATELIGAGEVAGGDEADHGVSARAGA